MQERRASDDVGDREVVRLLLDGKARLVEALSVIPVPDAAVVAAPLPVPERAQQPPVAARPKDKLLSVSRMAETFQRAGSGSGNSRGVARATVLSTTPHMQAADRAVAALVACVRLLIEGALVAPSETVNKSFAQLFEFRMPNGGGAVEFVRVLLGDHKQVLVNELLRPSLDCDCCVPVAPTVPPSRVASSHGSGAGGKRRKTVSLADREPGRWDHIFNSGPLAQLATREDITIAFLYYYRMERADHKLEVADWFAFFSDVLVGQEGLNARFQRVMQELQLMGLIASIGGKAQHAHAFVRKTLDE